MKDYANMDGKKIKRIMSGGNTEYLKFPKGIIKEGVEEFYCPICNEMHSKELPYIFEMYIDIEKFMSGYSLFEGENK